MDVADEGGFAAAPGFGQIGEANGNASDACPTGVEDAVEADGESDSEQDFHDQVEVGRQASQSRKSVNYPGKDGAEEQEAEQAQPCGGGAVKKAQEWACIAESEERGDEKAHRQHAEKRFEPKRTLGGAGRRRIDPSCIEEQMGQKKNRLNDGDEAEQTRAYPHT